VTAGDRALRDAIVTQEPVLGLPAGPLAQADALLRWASGVMTWSNAPIVGVADFAALSAGEMVDRVFGPRAGGVACGGMGVFYRRLLDLFGVPSVLLQCGFEDSINHVTVLVPADGRWFLFDPMFAGTYRPADAWGFLDLGAVLGGRPFVFRSHRAAPAMLRRPEDVAATKARWAARNVTACWTSEPNAHGWIVAWVTSVDYQHRLVALPEDLAALGIAPQDDLLSALVRRRVFALSGATDDVAACAAMLRQAGANLDAT
jgi:hypothetical protein